MSLPPWDQETFSFGVSIRCFVEIPSQSSNGSLEKWNFESGAIPQCSILKLSFDNDLGDPSLHANPAPAPPYTVSVYQGGYAPLTLAVGNIGQVGTYPWTVNLPVNNPFMLTMKDSAGYTGGTSTRFTVMPGSSNCSLSANPMPPPSLSFTRTGNSQCGKVNIVVNNGTSPYQVEIIPEVRQQKTLHFATNVFDFVLDIPMSLSYIIAVTDAEGHSAIDGILAVGSSSDGSCLNAATTMTVGKFTSMITGSGVSMPSATGTATGAGATQTGSNNPPKSGPKRCVLLN
ncbi:hypothetical protein FRC12_021396 [Ceratobasidium sp. 428]|nr:hypothetical protein FRC12_021396 [Ceratobasidium sp. 428]